MKIRRIPIYILVIANVVAVLGLIATGYAYYLDPNLHGYLALMGYAFPFLLIITLLFLAVWVFIKKRYLLISLMGLLLTFYPVTLYSPLNNETSVPKESFEVLTFNTHNWGRGDKFTHKFSINNGRDENNHNVIIKYLTESNADIICLQESGYGGEIAQELDSTLYSKLKYHESVRGARGVTVWVVSRFPIVRTELIPIETSGNIVAAFWLKVQERELIVVNCHLQTTGITPEERMQFSEVMNGNKNSDSIEVVSRSIFKRILESTKLRVRQANTIADFTYKHRGTPIIVCGDFNDIPHSHVHYSIADGLTDCYQQTGWGPGYSFTQYGMHVRIDNMLCSYDLKPYNCFTDKSVHTSDHFPVRCKFTFKK